MVWTYFHVVIAHQIQISKGKRIGDFEIIEIGLCDYFACSYSDNPIFGENAAELLGMDIVKTRNLEKVTFLNRKSNNNFKNSLVWSGASWELGKIFGQEKINLVIAVACNIGIVVFWALRKRK